MINFLEETKQILLKYNRTFDDIIFVCDCATHTRMTINDFVSKANFTYFDGFGQQIINSHLMLVGEDFWLERHEDDGSEWWEYMVLPKIKDYAEGEVGILWTK